MARKKRRKIIRPGRTEIAITGVAGGPRPPMKPKPPVKLTRARRTRMAAERKRRIALWLRKRKAGKITRRK